MDKQGISSWLKNASEKSETEIGTFLLDEIKEQKLDELWQKHYFLEDLKRMSQDYPSNVLEILERLENNIKDEEGVPMFKRHIAYIIDWLVYSLLFGIIVSVIDSISPVSNGFVLMMSVIIYFGYFVLCIYKYNTTVGSHILKINITFNNISNLVWSILLRELLFLTVFTGIGFIVYLIIGPYWDRATGAEVKWVNGNI
ncbi:MAG: RDD family protein [Patescibacteria group bacterium]